MGAIAPRVLRLLPVRPVHDLGEAAVAPRLAAAAAVAVAAGGPLMPPGLLLEMLRVCVLPFESRYDSVSVHE